MKTNGILKVQTPNGVDTYELTLIKSDKGASLTSKKDAIATILRANIKKLAEEKKALTIELSKLKKETSKAKPERAFFIYTIALMVVINITLIILK